MNLQGEGIALAKNINISIDDLRDNIGEIREDGKEKKFYSLKGSKEIPIGTYFKIQEIIHKHQICDVGYIPDKNLWYVLLDKKILWTNYPITTYKSVLKPKPKSKFNRYSALLGR